MSSGGCKSEVDFSMAFILFIYFPLISVLLARASRNIVPQMRCLKTNRNLFSQILGDQKSKIKVWAGLVLSGIS